MKLFLLYLSGSFILIATIGISFLQIYDNKIRKEREKREGVEFDMDISWSNLEGAEREYSQAMSFKNHLELLKEIGAEQTRINKRGDECYTLVNNAIAKAYAAATLKIPTDNIRKEWRALNDYSQLYNMYYRFKEDVMETRKRFKGEIESINIKITKMENTSMLFFKIFIALNSVGLLLGILSAYFDKE
jgi:hypothetical protein